MGAGELGTQAERVLELGAAFVDAAGLDEGVAEVAARVGVVGAKGGHALRVLKRLGAAAEFDQEVGEGVARLDEIG